MQSQNYSLGKKIMAPLKLLEFFALLWLTYFVYIGESYIIRKRIFQRFEWAIVRLAFTGCQGNGKKNRMF